MNKIIKQASLMFEKRYETSLKIKWSSELQISSRELNNWQTSFVYSRTQRQVSFPLFNQKKVLQAIAIVGPVDNKDAILFEEMSEFLKLTIAEPIDLQCKDLLVEDSEQVYKTQNSDTPNNIIKLPRRRSAQIEKIIQQNQEKRTPDRRPIYLYGDSESLLNSITLASHEWANNWAYLNAKELPDLIWKDKEQWKDFQQMTIHIPNAESLTTEQLEILKKNLQVLSHQEENRPLLILSGKTKIEEWNPRLAKLFKTYKPSGKLPIKSQAHFLMFHFRNKESWTYQCSKTKKLFYYPFSKSSQQFH